MSDKKVCGVCGREQCDARLDYKLALNNANAKLECYRLGYERLAAILTPEVLRLIEAGREYQRYMASPEPRSIAEGIIRINGVLRAALALPFEKPVESNHTEKQQLPKKGGEP